MLINSIDYCCTFQPAKYELPCPCSRQVPVWLIRPENEWSSADHLTHHCVLIDKITPKYHTSFSNEQLLTSLVVN